MATREEIRAEARLLYDNGQKAFDAGRYSEALNAFEQAYNTLANPTVLGAIAATLEKMGQREEALEQARKCVRLDPSGPSAPFCERLVERLRPKEPEAPAEPPTAPLVMPELPQTEAYGPTKGVRGVWIATGVGLLALVGGGWWLVKKKRDDTEPELA